MNQNIQLIWQETLQDIAKPAALWQLGVLVLILGLAWAMNGMLRSYVKRHASEQSKLGVDSIKRILFPISALIMLQVGKYLLSFWQHTSMLHLASTLLLAMAVIRLLVFSVRYVVSPSAWLKSLESTISSSIWAILALHLSGLLPDIIQFLNDITFRIGKSNISLWLIIQALFIVLVTILIALWCSRLLEQRLMRIEHMNINMRVVFTKLVRTLLIFIAVMISLSALGLDLTLLSVFGGALGVGLGFGLQRIASNYVSGFILLLDNSMQIGDIITVDDKHHGVIHDLRTRYLVLKKADGTQVIVPNESLIVNAVINHSIEQHSRIACAIKIAYQSDLELALSLMLEVAKNNEFVLDTPAPSVIITAFTNNGIELQLSTRNALAEDQQSMLKSTLFLGIWKIFKANNIEFARETEIKIKEVKLK